MTLRADLAAVLRTAIPIMLGWEVIAAVVALATGTPHERFALGDYIIYASTGFAVARRRGVFASPLGGAAIAAVDATLGWTIAWVLGPGRPEMGFTQPWLLLATVCFVIVIGAALGISGGIVGEFFRRRRAADA
jgi:hypothetical protein